MGSHMGVVGDEESSEHNGIRIQPILSTPMAGQWKSEGGKQMKAAMSERLGLNELFSAEVWRCSLAELFGTALLVFLIDTIVISSIQTETKTPNLIMSVVVAITITILVLATAPISGGHINPVITFSAALLGLISFSRAAVYFLAQCVGGVLGALALRAVVNDSIEKTFSLGGCTLSIVEPGPNGPITIGLGTGQGLWIEVICTFIFLFASVWIAFDERQAKVHGAVVVCSIIGTVIGLLVFVSTTVTATKGYAGAGMNPARCLGPALIRGGHLWDGHWVFWAGPAIACSAFYLYIKIIPNQHFQGKEQKHDFLNILRHSFK